MPATSTDRALQSAFMPIQGIPIALSGTAGTTSAILTPDLAAAGPIRRVSIVNTHATQTLAVVFVPKGQAPGAESTASGRPILPGGSWDFTVQADQRMLVVGSAAGTTYGGLVSDV